MTVAVSIRSADSSPFDFSVTRPRVIQRPSPSNAAITSRTRGSSDRARAARSSVVGPDAGRAGGSDSSALRYALIAAETPNEPSQP